MHRVWLSVLSIVLCAVAVIPASANAEMKMNRVGVCQHNGKNYSILADEKGQKMDSKFVVLESNPATPEKLPRTTEGTIDKGGGQLKFPAFWRPQALPLSSCKVFPQRSLEEVIREFYVKSYFIAGEQMPVDDIEEVVRRGDAIAVKVRVLCKSDGLVDDVTLCSEVTLLDTIIPIDPEFVRRGR